MTLQHYKNRIVTLQNELDRLQIRYKREAEAIRTRMAHLRVEFMFQGALPADGEERRRLILARCSEELQAHVEVVTAVRAELSGDVTQ